MTKADVFELSINLNARLLDFIALTREILYLQLFIKSGRAVPNHKHDKGYHFPYRCCLFSSGLSAGGERVKFPCSFVGDEHHKIEHHDSHYSSWTLIPQLYRMPFFVFQNPFAAHRILLLAQTILGA